MKKYSPAVPVSAASSRKAARKMLRENATPAAPPTVSAARP